jgi:hypothetical protein
LGVLLGDGRGFFTLPRFYSAGDRPDSVAVGDFNGDGTLDLAVGDYFSPGVSVLLGSGDGSFQPAMTYDADGYPTSLAVGDFNGDVAPDLAVANFESNDVSILLNDNARTGPRPGGQPPGHGRGAATAVEPSAAAVPALPPAPDGLPTDVGMAVLESPETVTKPSKPWRIKPDARYPSLMAVDRSGQFWIEWCADGLLSSESSHSLCQHSHEEQDMLTRRTFLAAVSAGATLPAAANPRALLRLELP